MRLLSVLTLGCLLLAPLPATAVEDAREIVAMPAPMQAHMLANMRDHLVALDGMLAALARGDVNEAGRIAESRIGMSSLDDHGASHMAPFMPEGMRAAGTAMHRAASRLALAAQQADIEQSYAAQQKVFGALHEIIAACNACHAGYRLR